jgi:archaellum component FlaC
MYSVDNAASVVQIISFASTILIGSYAVWRKIDKRQTQALIETIRINDKLDRIENQFGPNGGGIREAVNTMSRKVDGIDARVTKIGNDVANLSGKFEQHVVETDK